MELNSEKIEQLIVREAADRIISDDTIYDRVKRDIDARVDKLFADRVEAQIAEVVDAIAREGFDRPFRKVDSFGRSQGEPTTISAELEKLIADYWNMRVGRDGKPKSDNYNTTTRAEWLMAKICGEDFEKEVKQHAVNVTGQLKDAFRLELQATVNRVLSELFHVRSLDDQGKGRTDGSSIHPKAGPVGS